jgi:hypothetical protein
MNQMRRYILSTFLQSRISTNIGLDVVKQILESPGIASKKNKKDKQKRIKISK